MDPVSHAALGRTLIALARRRPEARGTAAAAVLGSLLPDIDAVLMPFGWDRYLRVHEIGTHSAIGTFLCALLTAIILAAALRGTRWRALLIAAWVGASSHVMLDVVSGAQVRLWWPLGDAHVSLPLVAMADPWLLGLLVGALLALWLGQRRQRLAAAVSLAVVATFLLIKGAFALSAVAAYDAAAAAAGSPVRSRIVEARWATLREFNVFDSTADTVRAWHVTAGKPGAELTLSWPRARPVGPIATSLSFPTVQNFLRAHDLVLATTTAAPGRRPQVLWSDIRFCWAPVATGTTGTEPTLTSEDGRRRLACGLWFGGELAEDGRPAALIVLIGSITQTRAIGR